MSLGPGAVPLPTQPDAMALRATQLAKGSAVLRHNLKGKGQ